MRQTNFCEIYEIFDEMITSDMYYELTELDTIPLLQGLLLSGLYRFEFPRFDIFDYEEGYYDSLGEYTGIESDGLTCPAEGWVSGAFNAELTQEECRILALCMVVEWISQQLASTENIRMKYSGSDFHFTSQANHMAKLINLKKHYLDEVRLAQSVYKKRKRIQGRLKSTLDGIMGGSDDAN